MFGCPLSGTTVLHHVSYPMSEHIVSCAFSLCFRYLRQKGKSDPVNLTWTEAEFSASSLKKKFSYLLKLTINLMVMRARWWYC